MQFVDLHNDAICLLPWQQFLEHIKHAEHAGAGTVLSSVWTTNMSDPISEIKKYRQLIDNTRTKINLPMHIEDAWFLNEQNVDDVIATRPYSVGLTWNQNNNLAGGAHGDGELTDLGRSMIERLTKSGVVIDLAHLNKKSFHQVADQLTGQRLFCSHTCFDEINPHPRNIDREQIQRIVDSDGIVGLTLVNEFLGDSGVAGHIKYFHGNWGTENLGIGTDFFGAPDMAFNDYNRLQQYLKDHDVHIKSHDISRTLD
ncbi:MAG: membrane dipeptidase [Firmicutes bacterium]|nr:membrane dipeptidase [Bacillota bacterium]